MNARKSLLINAATTALAMPGMSFADSYWHSAVGERGYNEYPNHLKNTQTRSNVGADPANAGRNEVSEDGFYRFVGPETGWQLIPHSYAFNDSKLVHTDPFDHATKRPSLTVSEVERQRMSELYSRQ